MVTLSVLDQSPIREGGTPQQAIQETLALAEAVDKLGYARYWLAEHHSTDGLACASPEVLIPVVAARTQHLRVGSGGVMLTHYSPLKVAETFRMLEALFPGRIDLGLGRAPGSDRLTATALANGPGALGVSAYPRQVADLVRFLADELPSDHPFHGVRAMPSGPGLPEVWLLGSGVESGLFAADLGCGFSFAHFISQEGGTQAARLYRESFKPSRLLTQPRVSIGVSVLCAETPQRAEQLAASRYLWRLRNVRGSRGGVPSVQEALAYPYTPQELAYIAYLKSQGRSIVGGSEQVKGELLRLRQEFGTDDFVIVTICYDFADRLRSYELLAEAFELKRPEPVAAPSPA